MPLRSTWPPIPPSPPSRSQRTWPPGGALTFERAETSVESPTAGWTANVPLTPLPSTSSNGSTSSTGSTASEELISLARSYMASDQTLQSYAAAHSIEAALAAGLNAIAKARPADPMRALAELLPSDGSVAAPTLPARLPEEELERLRCNWSTLHGMHIGLV
mmetsp:Transcript_20833/g.53169  ORF Transcript_20833/g.53169 Transcript_20833/m.53169 type:complete len:162 (-) Transcript_20833:302-787(-)